MLLAGALPRLSAMPLHHPPWVLCPAAPSRCSFVEPLAAGSGIPEVKTYLNGIHIRGLLTIRTLITKLSGITFSIAAGLIAGGCFCRCSGSPWCGCLGGLREAFRHAAAAGTAAWETSCS